MLYLKAFVNVVIAIGGALVVALGTGNTDIGDISTQAWLVAAGSVLGSGAVVWWAENGPAAPAIKAALAFLSAGVASLAIAYSDFNITQAEWISAFCAAVVATTAVYQVTNTRPVPAG